MLMVFFLPLQMAQAGDDPYMEKKRCGPYKTYISHYAGGVKCSKYEGPNASSSTLKRPRDATLEKHPKHVMVATIRQKPYSFMTTGKVCEFEIEFYPGKKFFSHDHLADTSKGRYGDTGSAVGKLDINHATCKGMTDDATASAKQGRQVRNVWVVGDCCKNGDTGEKVKRKAEVKPAVEQSAKAAGGSEASESVPLASEKPIENDGSRPALADVPNLAPKASGIEQVESDSSVGKFALLPPEVVEAYGAPKTSPVVNPNPPSQKNVTVASKPKKVAAIKRRPASKPVKPAVKKKPNYTPGELIQRSLGGAN